METSAAGSQMGTGWGHGKTQVLDNTLEPPNDPATGLSAPRRLL